MQAIDNSSIDMALDSSVMIRSQDDGEIYARENNVRQSSSFMERLFPWTQTGPTVKICNNVKSNELIVQKTKDENLAQPTMLKETNVKAPVESTKTVNPQLQRKELLIDNVPQGASLPDDARRVSVLEMWNLIESVGIKRTMVDKVLTTDESISELYHTIERRIHYEREQDMIKRLKEHIAKRKASGSEKSTLLVKSA